MGQAEVTHVLPIVSKGQNRPKCLSRDCVELVKQALGAGTITFLAAEDAWKHERYLRNDQISEGRLWQRTDPSELGLEFSAASLDLLMWLTEQHAPQSMPPWEYEGQLTLGDEFLVALTALAFSDTKMLVHCFRVGRFAQATLAPLLVPGGYAYSRVTPEPDYSSWVSAPGCYVIESIQKRLAARWTRLETTKQRLLLPAEMRAVGQVQESVLTAWMDACEKANRRDLCRFLFEVAAKVYREQTTSRDFFGNLDTKDMRLAERTEVYQVGSALMRAVDRLRRWQTASQSVGYFDEGYAESQLLKSLWESGAMDEAAAHASRVSKELDF